MPLNAPLLQLQLARQALDCTNLDLVGLEAGSSVAAGRIVVVRSQAEPVHLAADIEVGSAEEDIQPDSWPCLWVVGALGSDCGPDLVEHQVVELLQRQSTNNSVADRGRPGWDSFGCRLVVEREVVLGWEGKRYWNWLD